MSNPYVPQGTTRRFKIPKTLAADFDEFLNNDIPNTVMDFELIHNWYSKFEQGYKPTYIRGELYPDSTKSRYENTDNNMNIRCSITSGIRKGDIVIEPDGSIYILDWAVHLQSNNAPSRALRCNLMLTVYENVDPESNEDGYAVDDEGFVIEPTEPLENEEYDPRKIIVNEIPANAYRYDGRPEYVSVSGAPGTIAQIVTLMTVQYNEQTKNIKIGQFFDWDSETYEIVDVNKVGIDINGQYGTLKLQAKRAAGGLHGYD